jgi:putative endonuclease
VDNKFIYLTEISSSKIHRKDLGCFGEAIAAHYLESRGYEIVLKNYRKPWGEIDIIAKKENAWVFVEVKTNRTEFPGGFEPENRVNYLKLDKMIRTAGLYMQYEVAGEEEWQIDVIAVTLNSEGNKAKVKHFKNI